MATEWRYRLILIVHVNANTPANRQALASAFVDNGSGETLADEMKMFDNVAKLSLASSPTVHRAFGVSVPVKADMRDALLSAIADIDAPLPQAQKSVYFGVSNVDGAMYQGERYDDGECFYTSRAEDNSLVGQNLTARAILQRLNLAVFNNGLQSSDSGKNER